MVVLHVIKERREADVPRSGVRDDPAGGEMSHARRGVGRGEHYDGRTILGARSYRGPEAVLPRPCDQVLGERRRHPANVRDPDFVDVIEASELRIDRRQRRCAELEAPGVVVQLEYAGVEGELVLVAEPPGDRRREPPSELVADVQQHDPRPTEQPLEPTRGEKVHAGGLYIDGHLSHRLVGVHQGQSAALACGVRYAPDVLDGPAREVDMRGRDESRPVIQRARDGLDRHRDLVRALDHDQLDATRPLREPLVGERGQVERGNHHPATAAVVQRLRHRLARRAEPRGGARRGGPPEPAARARPGAPPRELPGRKLVPARAVPAAPAARVCAVAHVHRLWRRERGAAARGRGPLREMASRDDARMTRDVEQRRRAETSRRTVVLKRRALEIGFDAVGVASLEPNAHATELDRWLAAGYAGTMTYLHRQAEQRKDPARIMPGAKVAVVTLTNYFHGDPDPGRKPGDPVNPGLATGVSQASARV